jgi:hypothetical protein
MTSSSSGEPINAIPEPREQRPSGTDRRKQPDRRYNRRPPVSDVQPPYFETFDRIATALEGIERSVAQRVIDLASHERQQATDNPHPSSV